MTETGTDQRKDGILTTEEPPEHTLVVWTPECTFELTYRSNNDPKDGVPVAQAVRAVNVHDLYCKENNLTPSIDMTIRVKNASDSKGI